jgi:arylsulfatase A-like enzyme
MTIDLLPTIARFTGAEPPKLPTDGKDIGPLLTGQKGATSPQEAYFFYWGGALQAVRCGKWKLHFAHNYQSLKEPGKDGKPGRYVTARIEQSLFDLQSDVGETKNVAADHPDIVARIEALADQMRDDLGDTAAKRVGKGVRPSAVVPENK